MRILVADQNAMLLAAIASTFGRHCVIVTATRRDICLEHLAQDRFDVVIACEKLRDCTGLELLSEIQTLAPHTLQIYSAPTARLAQLQSQLDHFRLLGTLSYPIDPRKLLVALKVARAKLPPKAARPRVRHVVLESEWDTGERLGILERELEVEPAEPPTLAAASPEPEMGSSPAADQGFGAGPDIPILGIEETTVSRIVLGKRPPAAEGALEVSFEQNPNRREATASQARGVAPPGKRTTAEPARIPIAPLPRGSSASTVHPTSAGHSAPTAHAPPAGRSASTAHSAPASHSASPAHPNSAGYPASTTHSAPAGRSASTAHSAPAGHSASLAHPNPAGHPASTARSAPAGHPESTSHPAPAGHSTSTAHSAPAGHPATAAEPDATETVDVTFEMLSASLGTPANDPSVEPPPPPPPPPIDTGGAANEPKFDNASAEKAARGKSGGNKPAADDSESAKPGSKPAVASAKAPSGATTKKAAPAGPQQRKQAVPTPAQRAAFQRAVARRKANRDGALSSQADALTSLPSMHTDAQGAPDASKSIRPHWHGTHSLTDLARMATNKRPLARTEGKFAPNRNMVMIGSGVAAVLLASVLAFQLTRSHGPARHSRQVAAAQLFTPNAGAAVESNANEPPPQVFGPPPGQTQPTANPTPNLPQPQVFDPNTAPDDPPPPPALEHPGPMEPPSASAHVGPPLNIMQTATDTE